MGQYTSKDTHLWGRIMNPDVSTYQDAQGNPLLYAAPSNLSPASEAYAALVRQRVEKSERLILKWVIRRFPWIWSPAPAAVLTRIFPPAAAQYQVARLAKATGKSEAAIRQIIDQCTSGKFLGVFGEERVNVLKVNLMLDGIL